MKCTASDDAQWGGWIGIGMGMGIGVYVYAIWRAAAAALTEVRRRCHSCKILHWPWEQHAQCDCAVKTINSRATKSSKISKSWQKK